MNTTFNQSLVSSLDKIYQDFLDQVKVIKQEHDEKITALFGHRDEHEIKQILKKIKGRANID